MGVEGTVQQLPFSLSDNPAYGEGSLRIQRPPLVESYISPPEGHKVSTASVDQHDGDHLHSNIQRKNRVCFRN